MELTTYCVILIYFKTCLKGPLKKQTKIGFQDRLSFNTGHKCCRMLQLEPYAILLTFIKLPFVITTFVLSIFEWPLKIGFTVKRLSLNQNTLYFSEEQLMLLNTNN